MFVRLHQILVKHGALQTVVVGNLHDTHLTAGEGGAQQSEVNMGLINDQA